MKRFQMGVTIPKNHSPLFLRKKTVWLVVVMSVISTLRVLDICLLWFETYLAIFFPVPQTEVNVCDYKSFTAWHDNYHPSFIRSPVLSQIVAHHD